MKKEAKPKENKKRAENNKKKRMDQHVICIIASLHWLCYYVYTVQSNNNTK